MVLSMKALRGELVGQVVTVPSKDVPRVIQLAQEMDEAASSKRIRTDSYYNATVPMIENRVNGCMAKSAFGLLIGQRYAPEIGEGARYSGRGELIYDYVVGGKTIKVRSTKVQDGCLLGNTDHAALPADIAVLLVGIWPRFVVRGFMFGRDLFCRKRYTPCFKTTGKPAYFAEQSDLVSSKDVGL